MGFGVCALIGLGELPMGRQGIRGKWVSYVRASSLVTLSCVLRIRPSRVGRPVIGCSRAGSGCAGLGRRRIAKNDTEQHRTERRAQNRTSRARRVASLPFPFPDPFFLLLRLRLRRGSPSCSVHAGFRGLQELVGRARVIAAPARQRVAPRRSEMVTTNP